MEPSWFESLHPVGWSGYLEPGARREEGAGGERGGVRRAPVSTPAPRAGTEDTGGGGPSEGSRSSRNPTLLV